jgi:hypothetical protein
MKSLLPAQIALFDNYFIDQALEDLMPKTENEFNNFKDILYDKFNRQGYLIQRDKYYVFQPFNENENLPTYYRDNIDMENENHVSINNYVKNKFQDIKTNTTVSKDSKSEYDFDSVLDYYSKRDEYDVVGILDKNTSNLSNDVDLFKIRPKQHKSELKRGTGIHKFKGAVCFNAHSKNELVKIISKIPNINKDDIANIKKLSRENICMELKNHLIKLEKYAVSESVGGIKKMTYIMVPSNHPNYPFPLNLEDRVKHMIMSINTIMGYGVDVIVKKHKDKEGYMYYEMIFDNKMTHDEKIKKLGFKLDNKEWKLVIN